MGLADRLTQPHTCMTCGTSIAAGQTRCPGCGLIATAETDGRRLRAIDARYADARASNRRASRGLGDLASVEPCEPWDRGKAALVDEVLLLAVTVGAPVLIGRSDVVVGAWRELSAAFAVAGGTPDARFDGFLLVALLVAFRVALGLVYAVCMLGLGDRATVGMRCLSLKLVRTDGSQVGLGRALARELGVYLTSPLRPLVRAVNMYTLGFRGQPFFFEDALTDTVVAERWTVD
jgi:uncharacterized RDD family membrane protein YckC